MSEPDRDEVAMQVFGQSYHEVLAFLKHEDDKINRVLTALAFLTAAAVTLYIFSRGSGKPPTLDLRGTTLTAGDVFFASFIGGVILALLAAIAALDPTSFYPRFLGAMNEPESILYYRAIGQRAVVTVKEGRSETVDRWEEIGKANAAELRLLLAKSYHDDARRLADRARHKVYRFTECNAFVELAIVSLGLLGFSRLNVNSTTVRWWFVSLMLGIYAWSPLYDFAVLFFQNFPDIGRSYNRERRKAWPVKVAFFFLPSALCSSVLLVRFHNYWPTIGYIFLSTVALRFLSLHLRRRMVRCVPAPLVVSVLTGLSGFAVIVLLWTS